MADVTREEAIDTLNRLKTTHMGDFGWDLTGIEALDFAISDMKRVEELEEISNRWRDEFLELCHITDDALNKIQTLEAKKVEFREYKKFPKVERPEIFKEEDLIGKWQKRFEEMEKVIEESQRRKRMTVQEAIDEVMNMKFAGGCGQYTKKAVLIVCAAAKHAIEEGESKKHLRKKDRR